MTRYLTIDEVLEIHRRVMEWHGQEMIHLEIGKPDIDTSQYIVEARS